MKTKNNSDNVFAPEFTKAVKEAANALLADSDFTTCVSAMDVASHKAVSTTFKVTQLNRLKILVQTAVVLGRVRGFGIRKGRDGGIHRVKRSRIKDEAPVNDTGTKVKAA